MSKKKKKKTEVTQGAGADPEPAPTPPTGPVFKILFFVVALLGAVADIVSKRAVFSMLDAAVVREGGVPRTTSLESVSVIGKTLTFQTAVNPGAVFGLFRGQWLFLVVFTLIALGIMGWVLFRSRNTGTSMMVGLGLVCAGALGNLWDRVFFGGVRDFIVFTSGVLESLGFEGGRWPTFNLADAWICIGIPLIILGDFLAARRASAEADTSPNKAPEKG